MHLKIDTGIGRISLLVDDGESVRRVCALDGIRIHVIMTHLPSSDAQLLDATLACMLHQYPG